MFSEKDLTQIKHHYLTVDQIKAQINSFRTGFGFLPIDRAATPADGVVVLDEESLDGYIDRYEQHKDKMKIVKFVPASGAATRMFKEFFEYADNQKMTAGIENIVNNAPKFALYDIIKPKLKDNQPQTTIQAMLDYGAHLPKALIAFHRYADELRTAMDEHLVEGILYAASNGEVHIHFTISAEHREGFKKQLAQVQAKFEKRYDVRYNISFSQQKNNTDTIAVTLDNEPFREGDGSLLFRPAGHGALLENLNAIDADLVVIKNIDNVTTDHLRGDTTLYSKVMAGMLIALQSEIFDYIAALDKGADDQVLENITGFISEVLSCELPDDMESENSVQRADFLRRVLNRPIRICAMVRNEGEQGGGPFWAKNIDGTISLQIAEPSQIAPEQAHLLKEGTHFNPASLVCGVKDYKGAKFDLCKFTDPATGFISEKSKNGRPLKAMELPGLWNGAMANWHTIFVEVPVSTFTPVKEVKDLLREQHQ